LRFLLLSDLHLGAPLPEWGPRGEARRGAMRDALVEAVDRAVSEPVDVVLLGGNLFDVPDPEEGLAAFLYGQLARLDEAGIPTVLAPGRHDGLGHPSCVYRSSSFPAGVLLVDWAEPRRLSLPVGDEILHLLTMTWVPGTTSSTPWKDLRSHEEPGVHVALLPAMLVDGVGALKAPGLRLPAEALTDSGLSLAVVSGENYSLSEVGPTTVLCPGSPVGLSFGAFGPRMNVVAEVTNGKVTLDVLRRDVPGVEDVTVEIGDPATDSVVETVRAATQGMGLARVRLLGRVTSPIDVDAVESILTGDSPVAEVTDDTELDRDSKDDLSVGGLFSARMAERMAGAKDDVERDRIRAAQKHGLRRLGELEGTHAH
jgi:hypothetical protein